MGESFWLGSQPKSEYGVGESMQSKAMESMLMDRAIGRAPSAAELMMNRGMQQQVSAGKSMAASMPGVSPGLAMRLAGNRSARAMSDVGQQMGILRAQEQAQAQQMLAQWLQEQERKRLEQDMFNAQMAQRPGMLGSILSTAGALGGSIFGGPLGGMAGGALGSGLGSLVGGPKD